MNNNLIENLTKSIAKLPGMGPRIAKRILLHLASNKEKVLLPLIENLKKIYEQIDRCKECGNLDHHDLCSVCRDENRNHSVICIVEEVADLWAIERANDKQKNFSGIYHVLNGKLSASEGKGIDDLNFSKLIQRVKNNNIEEIIIATSATIDGQTTAHFIAEILKDFNLKITRLAHGIPLGSELDYLDDGTISIALNYRSKI